jgi:SAM-dependent methyltransferase
MAKPQSKAYWNRAAIDNAAWYIATGFTEESPAFFASGAAEVDAYLSLAGVALRTSDTVVEIGCGAGRMTRRLSSLAGKVIATDISGEMLARATANLSDRSNVDYLEVSGEGDIPIATGSVDAVFSYITMQHVPTVAAQERYFDEALRVVSPGGWVLIQFRRSGVRARALEWTGHLAHRARGRRTMNRSWRGARPSAKSLLARNSDAVTVEILRFGRRHIWALARRAT